jgi:hypothetical protein
MKLIDLKLNEQELAVLLEAIDIAIRNTGSKGGNFFIVNNNIISQANSQLNPAKENKEENGNTQS